MDDARDRCSTALRLRSSPGCREPAGRLPRGPWRTSAGSSSTTCRPSLLAVGDRPRSPHPGRGPRRPSWSTPAAARSSTRSTRGDRRRSARRRRPEDRVPRGVRRGPGAPVRELAGAAPLQHGQRILDGLQARAGPAGRPPGQRRSRDRHHVDQRPRAAAPDRGRVRRAPSRSQLRATVLSFGFKYGIPVDADMVADVRFLPNPFWDEELRPLTGQDPRVAGGRARAPRARRSSSTRTRTSSRIVTDGYLREGKRYVTVAVGCTGGKHRSVAIAEALTARLAADGLAASCIHRDLGRE